MLLSSSPGKSQARKTESDEKGMYSKTRLSIGSFLTMPDRQIMLMEKNINDDAWVKERFSLPWAKRLKCRLNAWLAVAATNSAIKRFENFLSREDCPSVLLNNMLKQAK